MCASNSLYFLENYWTIPQVGVGAHSFDLRPFQNETVETLEGNDFLIVLKARQIGMTTVILAYAFWSAFFHQATPWLLISKNERASIKMLKRATQGYLRLPEWMKKRGPQLTSNTQSLLEFDNDSWLESLPATGDTGRGDSVYGAVLDEMAFMEYADSIYAAIVPLVYGKLIGMSTANGMGNLFHSTWLDSQMSTSAWAGVFYPWWTVPSRDDEWYEKQALKFRGQEWKLYQEYPSSPEEAFAKSGRTAFDRELLAYNDFRPADIVLSWGFDGQFYEEEISDIKLEVWNMPQVVRDQYGVMVQKPNYVVSVDVAEGLERGDWTVLKVFNVNTNEEEAVCRSHILVEELGPLIEALGYMYHTALVVVERNNHGLVPLVYLQEHRYPRLYRYVPPAVRRKGRKDEYGFPTTRNTKPKMVLEFLHALRDQVVLLHDEQFMLEAQTFVADGKGGYAATEPNHDDDVMSTLIGWQGVQDQARFPVVYSDYTVPPLTMQDVLEWNSHPQTASGLDTPIGQRPTGGVRQGLFIGPANIRRKGDLLSGRSPKVEQNT